jgi:hypothetical protein
MLSSERERERDPSPLLDGRLATAVLFFLAPPLLFAPPALLVAFFAMACSRSDCFAELNSRGA